jgi:Type II CAAX prenyl endopeptidase Rce1-like
VKSNPPPARARTKKTRPQSRNLLTSLVLVFPLFLIYQVGVLLTYPMVNGADFLTRFLFQNLGLSKSAYLGYSALVAAMFALAVLILRRRQSVNLAMFIPVLLESAIFAVTMGSAIVLVMTRAFGIDPHLSVRLAQQGGLAQQGIVTRMVMSIGAGVWEETTFRLGILMGVLFLCEKVFGMRRFVAVACAFAISSLLFSAAHHIPPYGDPFHLGVFTFRFLAGLCFALLFWFRGFAVAVYTHALYDLYVLVLHP